MQTKSVKVSIIIPARNEVKNIRKTLEAVLRQDYPDFEVVVVDNGSTDRTGDAAGEYPVTVVREDNQGTMWACERGRLEATGDIIVRMDADCLPRPDWLSKGVAFFKDPKVVMVSGPYEYYDAGTAFKRFSKAAQASLYPLVNRILQSIGAGAISIGGNTFIRAETLRKMGGFNTDLRFYGDDTDTPTRASKHGRVVFDRRLTIETLAPSAKRFGGRYKVPKYVYHFFKVMVARKKK